MEQNQIEKVVKEDNIYPQVEPIKPNSKKSKNGSSSSIMDQILVLKKDPAIFPTNLVIKDTYDGEV